MEYQKENKTKVCTIGLDFGSLSCRGILVLAEDGTMVAEKVFEYPHGAMYDKLPNGTKLPSRWVLQHPQDFLSALEEVVLELVQAGREYDCEIVSIGMCTCTSTVVAVDKNLQALSMNETYADRIHAWPKMWKHHGAEKEAAAMTRAAKKLGMSVLNQYGGSIGAEFYLPKIVQVYNEDREVYDAAYTFLELGDWLTSILAGKQVRGASYLGSKSLWNPVSGYPSAEFFDEVAPRLSESIDKKLRGDGHWSIAFPGQCVGRVCDEMAEKLGLKKDVCLSAPQLDGYSGLTGCGINKSGELMVALGTSSSFIMLGDHTPPIEGVCASVQDTIMSGYVSYAAGQAGTGDMLAWYVENMVPAAYSEDAKERGMSIHNYLTELASRLSVSESRLIALDWWNGNKSCLNEYGLSGMILGMTLRTKPENIYRALLEATAFGARVIVENFETQGVMVEHIIASGGISIKNPLLMQIYADVLHRPIRVCPILQTAALGASIYAASAAGIYENLALAVDAMGPKMDVTYFPNDENSQSYEKLFEAYKELHDYFGRGGNDVMLKLNSNQE